MKHYILNHHKLVAMIIQHEIRLTCYSRLSLSTRSTVGENLTMQPDPDGLKFGDKHSVAVMKDGMTVSDFPKGKNFTP